MSVTIKLSGKLEARLAKFTKKLAEKAARGQKAAAETLLELAVILVPRDTNYLAETGRVTIEGEGFTQEAIIGFGGTDWPAKKLIDVNGKEVTRKPSEYAAAVHERSNEGRDYLYGPMLDNQDELRRAMHEEMGR